MRNIAFITGTRADYGKLKPLIRALVQSENFQVTLYVTGMHLMSEYGSTVHQILEDNLCRIEIFQNQTVENKMEISLARTIEAISSVLDHNSYDLFIVHGDRGEALATAIACSLRNVRVGHIEGGEISGTVDNVIRHAVSKLSHSHFCANFEAYNRLISLGEIAESIHVIGSPDIDIMNGAELPSIQEVKKRYRINFENYAILLFHPVTTELDKVQGQAVTLARAAEQSNKNFIVIRSNNDYGSGFIHEEFSKLESNRNFNLIPSMRFEYFLSLLKKADFILGNSSAGVREAPHFGVPCINVGSRQLSRVTNDVALIINVKPQLDKILDSINLVSEVPRIPVSIFGDGDSSAKFVKVLSNSKFWVRPLEKIGY